MILIEKNNVKLIGDAEDILENLTALELTILMDEGLMKIHTQSLKDALRIHESKEHEIDIRKFKTPRKNLHEDNNR